MHTINIVQVSTRLKCTLLEFGGEKYFKIVPRENKQYGSMTLNSQIKT